MINVSVKVKENTFVRKKDKKIYNIGNKTGLYVGPVGDKHKIVIEGIEFFLFEDDFEWIK